MLGASLYAEIMVRPIARRTDAKVDEFVGAINATVIAIDRRCARLAAELRGRNRSLRLADALALATAIAADADLVTLDTRLARGNFRITEASTLVTGTATFTVNSPNQIEIDIRPSTGTPSHYTFIRT